jgi:hypothetical protein
VAPDVFPPAWLKEQCAVLWQRGLAACQRMWGGAAPIGSRGLRVVKDTGKKTVERLRTIPWQTLAYQHWKLLLGIAAVILLVIIVKVPQWQASSWQGQPGVEPKDLAKLQNDARTTLVQALGGAVLLIGLYFTLKNFQLTQDKQITEHYTRAVEQLGSDKLEVRLGAIYALERIARDSERDHWPIIEILTAYVRARAPWPPKDIPPLADDLSPTEKSPEGQDPPQPQSVLDIQAILTVLGRRTRTYGKGEDQHLNLTGINLRGADLMGAHLEGAYLMDAHLKGAVLMDAHLEEAVLWGAHLEGAILMGAHLKGADLTSALNLTVEELSTVSTLYQGHLDPSLREQIQQRYPHLLDKP